MHLKTLEIQGFKSFPERTLIDFHPGVTAIIGPNGSGKSNVTDAIRWVLGEQSVKTLRGARMEDVIFTGTQSRRAMSYAEVSITFDNSDRGLAVDYTELQVTRRLYRSGDSEYFLNKTACRLKDITTMFMDTGLGRDGYSIVGQGRVDEILSHRSEDRRRIFEEASGIVKFKTRKEESERKLQQTEQNLLRINDIINELQERIEPLGQQAETAKQFLSLSESLRTLDIALMLDTIDQNEANITTALAEKDLVEQDLMAEQDKLAVLRDDHRQATESIRSIEDQIETHRSTFNQLNALMGALTSQKTANSERIDQLKRRISQTGDQQQDLQNQLVLLDADLAAREKKAETLRRQQAHFEKQLRESEAQMQEILQQLSAAEVQIEAHKVELEQKTEAIYEQRNRIGQLKSQFPLFEQRKKNLASEIASQVSERDRLHLQREEILETINRAKQAETAQELEKASLKSAMEETRQAMQAAKNQADEMQQKIRNDQYRLQTLSELERNHEGYTDTVRRLMQQVEADPAFRTGVVGTLGDLIAVEPRFELAIEIALGPALSNIVTDDEATASRLIRHLKENRAGRATFLPIETIRGRRLESTLQQQLAKMTGYLGLASDLVTTEPKLQAIIESLLGRIVIAENLDDATQMARKTQYNCRIVTLEGDVVNPGGSLTGGFNRKGSSGVLGRAREIEQLKSRITAQQAEATERSQAHYAAEMTLQGQARSLATLEHQLLQLSHQRVREESQLQTLDSQLIQLGQLRVRQEAENESLQKQTAGLQAQMGELEQLISREEVQLADLRTRISQQEGLNKAEQQRRDDLREEISDLRVSMHSINESLQASLEILERIQLEKAGIATRQSRGQEESIEFQAEIERLQAETTGLEQQIAQTHHQSGEMAEAVRKLNEQRESLETQQGRFFDVLESQASRISTLQAELGRVQGRLERFELAGDEAKNRLWETYELTAQDANAYRQPIENRPEAVRKVSALRNSIKALGPVNLAAIDEYQSVAERYAFMGQQRDDIEASRHKLQNVINELTQAMQRQFSEHFQLINDNFKTVFSELFGGGMAELHLENPEDVLACGIEIKAQPPGKKLQSLLLLSGGERCLTAIALLFAILKLRPTPFCVLDEVEAALDDANVVRFSEYIRHYAEESQFILVTHRKGTMESADRLYGVTMQERGISRILSMQLSE